MARIGLLTTSYPRYEGDVAGVFVRGFARALALRGHHIEVLAPEPLPSSGHSSLCDERISITHVPYAPRALTRTFYGAGVPDNLRDPRAWPGLFTFPASLLRAVRARERAWDGLVSHWALPSALVAGFVRSGRPHLAVLHSADMHLMRRLPWRERWARAVANGATQLLFSNARLRNDLLSWVGDDASGALAPRTHVSPMGIDDAALYDRVSARETTGARSFVLLSLGRLVPIKGLSDAIEALRQTRDVELWIAGDGPMRSELERRARHANVRFFGHVHGQRKAELFSAADAFVAPSRELPSGRTEGMPTALLEAARAGLPIIASDVGGVGEVFRHQESALLVEPSDASAIAGAIDRLERDRELCNSLGRSARAIGERHLWSALGPRFEELLFRG